MAKLFVVPTPIGNLEDFTYRAVRVLKEVDLVLAEDTRTSSVLLKHYDVQQHTVAHHMFNEHQKIQKIVRDIQAGINVALISDAGTPAISDPGFLLVRECVRNQVEVECLPGATALIPALVDSALPCERFCFEGFLPPKKGRATRLQALADENRTMVFYESPHRLVKTLTQLADTLGFERQAAVSREISKRFENTQRGTLEQLTLFFANNPPKGEFVIVVQGHKKNVEM